MSFLSSSRALLPGTALLLASCQLVSGLGQLTTQATGGAGGAGTGVATTGAAPTTATSTTTTNASASATGKASASTGVGAPTTASGSSSSGLIVPLQPCGGTTDNFATLDSNKWTAVNAVDPGGYVHLTGAGYIELKAASIYDDCYVSIEVQNVNANAVLELGIGTPAGWFATHEIVAYDQPGGDVSSDPGGSSMFVPPPAYLGLAVHAGKVTYLYALGANAPWTALPSMAAPSWLSSPAVARVAVTKSVCALGTLVGASFTNFNVRPINSSDLPP